MYSPYNNEQFIRLIRQQREIEFHTVVLCQDKKLVTKAKEWLTQQKEIPYLPNCDMFAYYCPMCNSILSFKDKCNNCGQLVDWRDTMLPKPI